MKVNSIEDIQNLEGGIEIYKLEKIMVNLLDYLFSKGMAVSWEQGIDCIDHLIHLKKHDYSTLSEEICLKILDWIEKKYDQSIFNNFPIDKEEEDEKILRVLDLTLYTLFSLKESIDAISFLERKLKTAKNELEVLELKDLIEGIKSYENTIPSKKLKEETLSRVLERANTYLESISINSEEKLCGLRNTILEHESCYSIRCCLKNEQYLSPVKRTVFVGTGALFLSKKTNLIEFAGSDPFVDWVEWFELRLNEQENYWILEIDYDRKKLSTLKSLLNKNTPELLKLVNKEQKIELEDDDWKLERIKKDLEQANVVCQIRKRTRSTIK